MDVLDTILGDEETTAKKVLRGGITATILFVAYNLVDSLAKKNTENRNERTVEKKAVAGDTSSRIAIRLRNAIGGYWSNTDEEEVFKILGGGVIANRQQYIMVKKAYYALTTNDLESDLQKYLDPPYISIDWNRASKMIEKINAK